MLIKQNHILQNINLWIIYAKSQTNHWILNIINCVCIFLKPEATDDLVLSSGTPAITTPWPVLVHFHFRFYFDLKWTAKGSSTERNVSGQKDFPGVTPVSTPAWLPPKFKVFIQKRFSLLVRCIPAHTKNQPLCQPLFNVWFCFFPTTRGKRRTVKNLFLPHLEFSPSIERERESKSCPKQCPESGTKLYRCFSGFSGSKRTEPEARNQSEVKINKRGPRLGKGKQSKFWYTFLSKKYCCTSVLCRNAVIKYQNEVQDLFFQFKVMKYQSRSGSHTRIKIKVSLLQNMYRLCAYLAIKLYTAMALNFETGQRGPQNTCKLTQAARHATGTGLKRIQAELGLGKTVPNPSVL